MTQHPAPATEVDLADMPDDVIAAVAADLLAHWWSRPVEDEVAAWSGARASESAVCRRLAGDQETAASVLPFSAEQVPELLDEYERLFVGPGRTPCPPYESYWRDDVPIDIWHSLMGPCTADLRDLYRTLDIDVPPGSAELPDHVAVEFEALAFALTHNEGAAVADELLRDHLSGWLPRLCKAVAANAAHPYYQALAARTLDWTGHLIRLVTSSGETVPGDSAPGEAVSQPV